MGDRIRFWAGRCRAGHRWGLFKCKQACKGPPDLGLPGPGQLDVTKCGMGPARAGPIYVLHWSTNRGWGHKENLAADVSNTPEPTFFSLISLDPSVRISFVAEMGPKNP